MISPSAYQEEVHAFKNRFGRFKDKRIVLYGIGRYTASLVPAVSDFNIIGLMDRDPENIGKIMYGLPVISKEHAEKNADIIIINTSETYWNIIFLRICDLSVPVYYLNGHRAYKEESISEYENNSYWEESYEQLVEKVKKYDVISFDVFDTLIMWKIFVPQDIYKLIELRVEKELNIKIDFYKIRMETELDNRHKNSTLNEIYLIMNQKWRFSDDILNEIKKIEIKVTKQSIVPREKMVDLCNTLMQYKEVYFISDMYLPQDILKEILLQCGICKIEHLWVSSEVKKDKRSGELWESYIHEVKGDKKLLHIGDNTISDIEMPHKFGIDTYYVMSASDMLRNSSMGRIVSEIGSLNESMYIGLLCAKVLNDPFILCGKKGMLPIREFEQLGYFVFGGVICSFLLWLMEQADEKCIERFVFFARDGYFLEKDYLHLTQVLNEKKIPHSCYLAISRRLILIAAYSKEEDLDSIIEFPYCGSFNEYMFDRFHISIALEDKHYSLRVNLPSDKGRIRKWIEPYKNAVLKELKQEKANYKLYLNKINLCESDAVIDLWFYGHNQYCLSQILNQHLKGFYFAVNLSKENECKNNNDLFPCFQKSSDLKAEQCNLYKNSLWVESFLTAPYGMIKALDENGNFIHAPEGKNQQRFKERELINEGVCSFIDDYLELAGGEIIGLDRIYVDSVFGEIVHGNVEIADSLRDIFYYDNTAIQRRESPIFR